MRRLPVDSSVLRVDTCELVQLPQPSLGLQVPIDLTSVIGSAALSRRKVY